MIGELLGCILIIFSTQALYNCSVPSQMCSIHPKKWSFDLRATRYCTCCTLIWSSLVEHNYLNHWYTISLLTHAFSATSVTRYSHTHQCSNTNHWWRVNLLLLKILQALKDLVVLHELWERYSYQRCLTSVSVPLHCYSCYTPCWCFCCSKPISFCVSQDETANLQLHMCAY